MPDYVNGKMRVLLVGLNPSVYSADRGMGFARPGNRFWPAALGAGLVSRDRDPVHALTAHGIGMTDMVKRATARRRRARPRWNTEPGYERLEQMVRWLRPRAVCIIGLTGWRVAVDRKAVAGPQDDLLGESPVYVMPNTSGLNARVPLAELTEHLRARERARRLRPSSIAPAHSSASAINTGTRTSVPVVGSVPVTVDACSSDPSAGGAVVDVVLDEGAATTSVASSEALDVGAGPSA